jgi:hypothetical protein
VDPYSLIAVGVREKGGLLGTLWRSGGLDFRLLVFARILCDRYGLLFRMQPSPSGSPERVPLLLAL